ncbi:MAG: AraC family transcriptional regulator [Caldimonas sp.]
MKMNAVSELDVGAALLRSNARLLRTQALPAGVWLAHWGNADTTMSYLKPGHHTLSLYLEGGHEVRCHQAPAARGHPGSLCLLPAEHESHWDVHGSLQLLHLYLPTLQWALAAERWFDLDPRFARLTERVYFRDDKLAALGMRIAFLDWERTGAPLVLQQLVLDVQVRLITAHVGHGGRIGAVRGGLSPTARRRVLDHVESHLAERIDLRDLAESACLSEFHFARMFKTSFNVSPHAWVMQRRLTRARAMLCKRSVSLEEVANRCGYAHLSHLNSALKRAGLRAASSVDALPL